MKCVCGYEQEEEFEEFEYEETLDRGYMKHWKIPGLYVCPKCGTTKMMIKEKEKEN